MAKKYKLTWDSRAEQVGGIVQMTSVKFKEFFQSYSHNSSALPKESYLQSAIQDQDAFPIHKWEKDLCYRTPSLPPLSHGRPPLNESGVKSFQVSLRVSEHASGDSARALFL